MSTITKGLLGKEDLKLKESGTTKQTFTRGDSEGKTLTLEQIDAAHLQYRTIAKQVDDLVDGGYDVEIKPKSIHGGSNNTNGHTVPDIADDTFALLAAAQTFTNKTLTTPTVNGGTVSGATINSGTISGATTSGNTIKNATIDDGITMNGDAWPSFAAYMSGNQAIATTAYTKVSFDTERFDTNSNFDSATNYRFTPTVAGKYLVIVRLEYSGCDAAGIIPALYKNGALYTYATDLTVGTIRDKSFSTIVDMDGSTDYLEVFTGSQTDSSYSVTGAITHSRFEASRIA